MSDFITPLTPEYTIFLPEDSSTLLILGAWFLLILVGMILFRDRYAPWNRPRLSWLAILSALVLFLTPFLGVRLFPALSEQPVNAPIQHFMFLAAVPWMVAGGVLGALPAGLIAGISGLLLAYLDTHQIATPLLLMTVSLLFSYTLRQRQRVGLASLLRFPLASAILTWVVSTPVVFISLMLSAQGSIGLRFAAAFEGFPGVFLTLGGMVLIGGLAATLVRRVLPESWEPDQQDRRAEPIRYSNRLPAQLGFVFLVLLSLFSSTVWRISKDTVRRILVSQLTDSARAAADSMGLFINTGKAQADALAANSQLTDQETDAVNTALIQEFSSQSYFDQLGVFTLDGSLITSYPSPEEGMLLLTPEEASAIPQAGEETSPVILVVAPNQSASAAQLSILNGIQDATGGMAGVLLGRSSIANKPVGVNVINSLMTLEEMGGVAQIIDGDGRRLYHTNPNRLLTDYIHQRFSTTTFFESTTLDNQPMMMYYQPIDQEGWAVVTAFPVEVSQLLAWEMAYPLLLAGLLGSLILFLALFIIVSFPIRELDHIKFGIKTVMSGQLPSGEMSGRPQEANYEAVFTQTLASLNRRIQQQRDLLTLYGPIRNSSNLKADLTQVMKAALAQGVSSVRIILKRGGNLSHLAGNSGRFGLGKDARLYAAVDSQVSSLVSSEGVLVLRDMQISELLSLPEGTPYPASLLAFPIKSNEAWMGVFWATFPDTPDPGQEEVNFFKMLADRTAEIFAGHALMEDLVTRQRQLESALDDFPQAVLLMDAQEKILYHNDRFRELVGSGAQNLVGRDVFQCLEENHQSRLARIVQRGDVAKEIRLENGSVLQFRKAPVEVNGIPSGSVLVFEPLRGFRTKLDSSTELVTIVSHALRSPLTLIHGYAKILRLTGNLNDQQDDYISKIIKGIEEMRSLVQNLLEVGRLESLGVMDFSEFQVSQVLEKISDSMEAQFRQKNIHLSLSQPAEPITLRADFALLNQALKNLVDNALKFTKMGGKVTIHVQERDGRVVFSVQDTGPGIAPLDQRHLFEKFQYARDMRGEETEGSGLGLAIVRTIVDHHDGRVWVESQLGKGSTFFVEIPKHPD